MQHLSHLGWPRGGGGVQAQNGELKQDGEQLGVFHIPAESPVCLAKGTTSQLSPALWDLQLGLLCSTSPWWEGNLGMLAERLGWWEL